jgi:AcrR family transcriptional regulator
MARPPNPDLDTSIGATTLELLGEVGFDRLSIAAVATRARTTRASVYRRWPDKTALVLAAVDHEFAGTDTDHDTGSLRTDLLAQSRALAARLGERASVLTGLVNALRDNGELGSLVRSRIIASDYRIMTRIIARAVARGELSTTSTDSMALTVPVSMMFARVLLMAEPLDDDYLVQLHDQVVLPLLGASFGPKPPATSTDP